MRPFIAGFTTGILCAPSMGQCEVVVIITERLNLNGGITTAQLWAIRYPHFSACGADVSRDSLFKLFQRVADSAIYDDMVTVIVSRFDQTWLTSMIVRLSTVFMWNDAIIVLSPMLIVLHGCHYLPVFLVFQVVFSCLCWRYISIYIAYIYANIPPTHATIYIAYI